MFDIPLCLFQGMADQALCASCALGTAVFDVSGDVMQINKNIRPFSMPVTLADEA